MSEVISKITALEESMQNRSDVDTELTLRFQTLAQKRGEVSYIPEMPVQKNVENLINGGGLPKIKDYLRGIVNEALAEHVLIDEGVAASGILTQIDRFEQMRLFPEPLTKKQQAELEKLTADLTDEFARWEKQFLDGGSDAFYEDGIGLLLIRNHIINDKRELEEKFPDNLPEIYYKETPSEYPNNYQSVKKGDTLRFEYGDFLVLNIEKTNEYSGEYTVQLQDENGEVITQNLRDIKTKFRNLTNRGEVPSRADVPDITNIPSDLDKFYVDKDNERVTWIYYNPDSDAGGQLVYNHFSFDQIFDAISTDDVLEHLEMVSSQETVDITAPEFENCAREFLQNSEDLNSSDDEYLEKLAALTEPYCYVFQLKDEEQLRDYRFAGMAELRERGLYVDRENYRRVYRERLENDETLDDLYVKFNASDRPDGFYGHSLSTGDIIGIKRDGKPTAYYVDSVGFVEIPDFLLSREERKARRTLSDNLVLIAENQLASDEMDTLGDKLFDYDNAWHYSGSGNEWLIGNGMTADEFEAVMTRYHNGEDVRAELAKGLFTDNGKLSSIEFFGEHKDDIGYVNSETSRDENGMTFKTEGGFEVTYSWEQLGDAMIAAAKKEFDRHKALAKAYREDLEKNGNLYLALRDGRTIYLNRTDDNSRNYLNYRLESDGAVAFHSTLLAADDADGNRVQLRDFGTGNYDYIIHSVLKDNFNGSYELSSIENEPIFKVERNSETDGEAVLKSYIRSNNELLPGEILYSGSVEDCEKCAEWLRLGENSQEEIKKQYLDALNKKYSAPEGVSQVTRDVAPVTRNEASVKHELSIGDQFRNMTTGEVSKVTELTGALPWYTDDCTVVRKSGDFIITENIGKKDLLNGAEYEFIGNENLNTEEMMTDFIPYNEKKVITATPVGDFYEFFGDTAKELSEKFNLALTTRGGKPMVGVPQHRFDDFCSELYDKGYIVTNWQHYQDVIKPRVEENPSMIRAETLINEFCENEYESEGDFTNRLRVGLAYTDDEQTGYPIEVYADLEYNRIITEFNGVMVSEDKYKSLDEMCDLALEHLDFDDLVYLSDEKRSKVVSQVTRDVASVIRSKPKPTIICEWSESPVFEDGKAYSIAEFDRLMKQTDDEHVSGKNAGLEKYGSYDAWREEDEGTFYKYAGYDKVKFTVNMPDGTTYTERQDIGDGYGGVIDFLSRYYPEIIPALKEARDEEFLQQSDLSHSETKLEAEPTVTAAEQPTFFDSDNEVSPAETETTEKVSQGDFSHSVKRGENFKITDEHLGEMGAKAKFAANIAAIKTLNQIESENRQATPEEQQILSKYVGWGGIPQAFDSDNSAWNAEYTELKDLLSAAEYADARSTVLTAHYTSPVIISAMYKALENFGFKGGNLLEPAMGIGNFFGVMPDELRKNCSLSGVELDSITGRIAKQLYPNAGIQVCGYENTTFSDNFFDAAIGNVPFGSYPVEDARYNRENFLIHDYFFAKTLDKVAPGGIVAFITSKGTLDKESSKVREYLAKRADLVGAVRLPNTAFKANAGTEVTADIIFLQKRDKQAVELPDWCYTAQNSDGIWVNQYFIDHPEMVLGKMQLVSGRFGKEAACVPVEGAELKDQLNRAVARLKRDIVRARQEEKLNEQRGFIPAVPGVRNFTYTNVGGKIYFREDNVMFETPLPKKNAERMNGLIAVRDTFREVIDAQTNGCTDKTLTALQARLNDEYDSFVSKFGFITDKENRKLFEKDDDYTTMCGGLEIVNAETQGVTKSDVFTKRTIKPYVEITHTDTPLEALYASLDVRGMVDIDYMAALCGSSSEDVIKDLTEGGFIYKNPKTEEYEDAAEYLSGYVRDKLRTAQKAAMENPEYARNAAALEKVQPEKLGAGDISVRLGASWITPDDYCAFFIEYAHGTVQTASYGYGASRYAVLYRSVSGEYKIENKGADKSVAATSSFGTSRMSSYNIFENLLNNRDIAVYDTLELPDGKKKRVMNKKETQIAQEKARQMAEAFPRWLWENQERRDKYVEKYNDLFNSLVGREYDGSHQTFPGMSPTIELNEHQKNAVMRCKLGGNTLLAHCVGAGKTFEMAAAIMEKRRLGLINKACIVVPKHLVGQTSAEWLRLYPEARLLAAKENDFNEANRKKFIGRCCTGDYDAVIMSYEQFAKIPMSREYQERFISAQIDELSGQLSDVRGTVGGYLDNNTKRSIKDIERVKKNYEAKLKKLLDTPRDTSLNFEQLGFDSIVVDEAHNYKNGLVVTKMKNVSGLGSKAAQKCEDFLMKTQYLNETFGERNLILASGTPVSNSMTELYIMQQYLRPSALRRQGLENFDDWASTFGEVVSQLEIKPAGDGFRMKKRFAKFNNLPELMQAYKDFADIRTADMLNLPVPEVETGKPQIISAKPDVFQQAYMKVLAARSEAIHNGSVDPSEDNMLKVTNEARLLGLDARCLNPEAENCPDSKINLLCDKVMEIYIDTTEQKGVQAIFCDIAVNGGAKKQADIVGDSEISEDGNLSAEQISELLAPSKFSAYEYIKEELIRRGIPKDEICFASDADTQKKRGEMYAQLRAGTKRIVLASTTKMGTGANIQTRLCALHNLDIPWKPSDFSQREGRIVRQGNCFPTVKIFNYVTEGTFDAYMLNLIVTKQKFISQLMSGKTPARTCEDVDDQVLNYSEMQAIASGDPRIKEKIQLDMDVSRLRLLEHEHYNKKYSLEDKVTLCTAKISITKKQLSIAREDKTFADKNVLPEGEFKITLGGKTFDERKDAGAELRRLQMKFLSTKKSEVIGEYRGFEISLNWAMITENQSAVEAQLCRNIDGKKGLYYTATLDMQSDIGSVTRVENILKSGIDKRISGLEYELSQNENNLAEAMRTKDAPFEYAEELAEKSARLIKLNAELGVDKADEVLLDDEDDQTESKNRRGEDREKGIDGEALGQDVQSKKPKHTRH